VVFRIRDPTKIPADTDAPSASQPAPANASSRIVYVQEKGETVDRFAEFKTKRSETLQQSRSRLEKSAARFEVVCYEIISYCRKHQDIASSFLNLFKSDNEIPLSIELENPTKVKVCPISGYASRPRFLDLDALLNFTLGMFSNNPRKRSIAKCVVSYSMRRWSQTCLS